MNLFLRVMLPLKSILWVEERRHSSMTAAVFAVFVSYCYLVIISVKSNVGNCSMYNVRFL